MKKYVALILVFVAFAVILIGMAFIHYDDSGQLTRKIAPIGIVLMIIGVAASKHWQ